MHGQKTSKILPTALLEHPAFKAWSELQPKCVEPERIEILKRTKKSTVYRLVGVGPEGTAVIAKRSVHSKASVERAIYEEILPHLSISSIRYYGFVEEDDGQYDWLFLACADGNEYSGFSDKHRALSAQWLASLHSCAVRIPAAKRLPGRGPDHYLEHLKTACAKIVRNLANPALNSEDVEVLKRVVSQCHFLASRWSDVERLCAGMPQTLIHGDFSPKNMRVQTEQAGISLQVFDWGTAGWGLPAADLVQSARRSDRWASPNLEVYYFVVRESWPHLNIEAIQRLATAGKIFRALVRLNGDAGSLKSQWAEWTIGNILVYQSHMDDAIEAAGLDISVRRSVRSKSISQHETPNMIKAPWLEHPAVRAWRKLKLGPVEPERIATLREKRGSSVYRLEGVRPENFAIIAKRTWLADASVERMIYEQVLPHVAISSLNYHGFVEDGDNRNGWLFLGYADGKTYTPSIQEHRVLAARWLGLLHTSSINVAAASRLPNRGPNYYLEHLQSARGRIIRNFANPALGANDREVLKKTLSHCAGLESRWNHVTGLCSAMPQTLTHGDITPKHLRIQIGHSGIALQVFGWGQAGWGVPCVDLVQTGIPFKSYWVSPDLNVYCSVVRECWPDLDVEIIRSLANIGKLFRLLVWINLEAKSLETQWVKKTMTNIRTYLDEMGDLTWLS